MPPRGERSSTPAPRPTRAVVVHPLFLADLGYWIDTEPRVASRLVRLVEAILRDPFTGIGKPEPLRHLGPNTWSRRLTQEHRIVYRVEHDRIELAQARYHYAR
ncbi:MAG: Txe/YoeB family addiction module toxin [Chloroflexota bacterium]